LSVQEGAAHRPAAHTPLAQSEPVPHPCPVPQRAHAPGPPQSVPVSLPFFTPSLQVGAAHAPPAQTPLAQFAPLLPHIRPVAHGWPMGAAAHEPPQSTSLSLPFSMPSLQLAGVQVPFAPQMPFRQSAATAQPLPSPHFLPVGAATHEPPQSTAVSLPFFTPSLQVGAAHAPPVQTPLVQLAPAPAPLPHRLPVAQGGHEPPQSTSVSVLFFTMSAQFAAAHTPFTQTPFTQSAATPHAWPSGHFLFAGEPAHEPPQSTAVSLPFFTPSPQVGAAQAPAVQTPLRQFPPAPAPGPHMRPGARGGQGPPQSTSVSLPFFTLSVQAAT
jgi:hypothetical protein